jgi:hypothetical protein
MPDIYSKIKIMAIIIKEINGRYELHNVTHTPINLNPFTKPGEFEDCMMLMKHGFMENLFGLELEKEYALDVWNDFEEYKRDKQVSHVFEKSNLVYDDVYYKLKTDVLINHKLE